jgi:hemoglobin/transferrin/lactoferrin receptor protein
MLAMGNLQQARAQETKLPGITVEGGGGGSKKKAQATAPSKKKVATPAPAPAQPSNEAAATTPSEAAYQTPAAVSAVGQGEIQTFGQVGLDNVIRTMPGTFTRENPNNPGVAVNIRGFEGSGRVNMMIDGVRQNFRFTGHDAQGFVYVDPALLAGIDIQRGAVSTAGGAGALAGTANFRTLGVDDIIKAGQNVGALTSVTWGSNGLGFAEMGAVGARAAGVGIAGAISKRDQDDYKNGEGTRVPFTDQDLISGLAKAELALDSEQRLKLGGVFYDNDFLANGYLQNLNTKTYTANYTYNPVGTELISLRLNAYHNDVEMKYLQGLTSSNTEAGRVIDDEGWGFDATNVSRFHLGSVRVRSEYGYEYFFDDVDAKNTINPTLGGGANPSGKSSISGPFSQTTFSYGIFDLIGGLRYDQYALEGSGIALAGSPGFQSVGGPFAYSVDRDDQRLDPKITLAATPLAWLQPYVTYSESMRAPTISEALVGGIHPGSVGVNFAPNPFLDPEIQKGWEFGFNVRQDNLLQRGDAFRLKADYFTMDVENYITTCLSVTPAFTVFAYFCNALGTSRVDGVEVQGTYDAGYAFGAVSYTYTTTTLASQFNGFGAQSYLPDSILTLTGGLRFLNEKLTVGARGYIVSQSYNGADQVRALLGPLAPFVANPNGNPDDPFNNPYELLDLFGSYKWSDSVDLSATVTNVFNRAYTPALSTPISSSPPFTEETGRGRMFLLTTRAQF